ncbi:hypothetical protein BACCAP_04343 [Pseudoflavonifractor capillosus ATCC 29799]|uniref:Uncharacterized protein n=1 Tax=Pseudoflavonifractor capillosus ATCC 29799 TaxID=411467 RepID=A6P1H6_9FIRM|nr:hypothetical protein BACCAP_04343 [Pseudoflavonifractor capillosus ATCC 29799]
MQARGFNKCSKNENNSYQRARRTDAEPITFKDIFLVVIGSLLLFNTG